MANLNTNPPLYANMLEEKGENHVLTQGWIQWFSSLISAVQGTWNKYTTFAAFSIQEPVWQRCNATPYAFFFQADFENGAPSQTITFTQRVVGALVVIDGASVSYVWINGTTATLPTLGSGAKITAQLMEGK